MKKQIKKPKIKPVRLSISVSPELNDQIMELTCHMNMSKAKIVGQLLEETVPEFLELFKHVENKEQPINSGMAFTIRKLADFIDNNTREKS
jgi:hypothetical protein